MYDRPLTRPEIRKRPFSSAGKSTPLLDPSAGATRTNALVGLRFNTGSNSFPATGIIAADAIACGSVYSPVAKEP